MKFPLTRNTFQIPEDVEVTIKNQQVYVKGSIGELNKCFKYAPLDMFIEDNLIVVQIWNSANKQKSIVNSVLSQIKNMIIGVQQGFKQKMIYCNNHFPIQVLVHNNGTKLEVKNFLGEKRIRVINALPGVTIELPKEEKQTIYIYGTDLLNVTQTCSLINQSCKVKNKDIRLFLDGIYVQDRRKPIKDEE